jgi:hypothetical protein
MQRKLGTAVLGIRRSFAGLLPSASPVGLSYAVVSTVHSIGNCLRSCIWRASYKTFDLNLRSLLHIYSST